MEFDVRYLPAVMGAIAGGVLYIEHLLSERRWRRQAEDRRRRAATPAE